MDYSRFISRLKRVHLFHGLSEDQLLKLIMDAREVYLDVGEYLFKEGDFGKDFFFIEEGEVEVLKINPLDGNEFALATLKRGEVVGEMAFIKGAQRDASIKASKPTQLLVISIHPNENDIVFLELKSRISDLLTERLRQGNKVVIDQIKENLEHSKARGALGDLIVHLIALIFLYIYALRLISLFKVHVIATPMISIPVLALFGYSMYRLIKTSGYPISLYGFTMKGAGKAVIESILFSLPLFALIALAKWTAIQIFPAFHNLKLFHASPAIGGLSLHWFYTFIVLYAIFVPIQEFIYRGAIQSSLNQFLIGKHRTLQAILISNLPFSMIHLHLSFSLTFFVYFFGVFWGWMYARQQTLIGCTISHFIIGIWAFFIVGIEEFLVV